MSVMKLSVAGAEKDMRSYLKVILLEDSFDVT